MDGIIKGVNVALFEKYMTFSGRATRTEFWSFTLLSALCSTVFKFFLTILGVSFLALLGNKESDESTVETIELIAVLPFFLPQLAVQVRRLHDTGRSGWWMLIGAIPCFGILILLVFNLLPSTPEITPYDERLI